MDRTLTAHATLTLIEERITECRKTEHWYRANSWAVWNDLRHENTVELRALLKLARKARQTARLAVPDPMDEAKRRMSMDEALEAAYGIRYVRVASESEAELREAFGG